MRRSRPCRSPEYPCISITAGTSRFTSSIGYSFTEVDNTDGQTADAYNKGQYASANLLYMPVKDVLVGVEALWGDREDNGGNSGSDTRVQFSMKYNFGAKIL